jgi:hypothetical protein
MDTLLDTDIGIAVVLVRLFTGRLCGVDLEEAVDLFFGGLFFLVVLLFVFVVVFERLPQERCFGGFFDFDFADGAGLGEVEAFGRGFEGADDVGCEGFGLQAGGVILGELEAVEQGGGALDVELAGGEGVDDDGESDLDGFAVFQGDQFDVLAGDEVAAGGGGGAEGGVALVEAVVEVAPGPVGEGGGFAAGSVGLDVAAEGELHGVLLGSSGGGIPPIACV